MKQYAILDVEKKKILYAENGPKVFESKDDVYQFLLRNPDIRSNKVQIVSREVSSWEYETTVFS